MTTQQPPHATAFNRLSQREMVLLGKWIEGNLAQLSPATDKEVAEKATTALGITVTDHDVAGACTAFDLTIPRPAAFRHRAAGDRIQVVAAALETVLKALGMPVSDELKAVILRKRLPD